MKRVIAAAAAVLLLIGAAPIVEPFDDAGSRPLFDGRSLAGWHVGAGSTHSAVSGNRTGGRWEVVGGAIIGTQDAPGNGGLLISDEAFGDVEVVLETRIDFGVDSGLFFRTLEDGRAYQVTIDYLPGGSVGGIYGEALPGELYLRNFGFDEIPARIHPVKAPVALPIAPRDWPLFWHLDDWNEVRARITGNPPSITTWVNGVRFMSFTDDQRRLPNRGAIALQIHGGNDHVGQLARFRNIRVKPLD